MKSCPLCKRTFDDTMSFCLDDGSLLSAPIDGASAGVEVVGGSDEPVRDAPTVVMRTDEPDVEQQTVVRLEGEHEAEQQTVVRAAGRQQLAADFGARDASVPRPVGTRSHKLVYILGVALVLMVLFLVAREFGVLDRIMGNGAATPMAAVDQFRSACQAGDAAGMKKILSRQSAASLAEVAASAKMSLDDYLRMASDTNCGFEEPRNEKITNDFATVEVKSGNDWSPVRLIREDGGWKLAL